MANSPAEDPLDEADLEQRRTQARDHHRAWVKARADHHSRLAASLPHADPWSTQATTLAIAGAALPVFDVVVFQQGFARIFSVPWNWLVAVALVLVTFVVALRDSGKNQPIAPAEQERSSLDLCLVGVSTLLVLFAPGWPWFHPVAVLVLAGLGLAMGWSLLCLPPFTVAWIARLCGLRHERLASEAHALLDAQGHAPTDAARDRSEPVPVEDEIGDHHA